MDLAELQNLKTIVVKEQAEIGIASRLTKYYNRYPLQARKLDKIISSDYWTCAELLTALVPVARKPDYVESRPVAFVLMEECNLRAKGEEPLSDLFVHYFSMDPWFDTEIAVQWANYRVDQACYFLNRVANVLWNVDERNVPVQILLRDLGYKIAGYDRDQELLTFIK